MPYGCVDIGSNTTRLLVAEVDDGRLRELMTERVYTRIGKSLVEQGRIPMGKIAETAEVAGTQARHAVEHGAERIEIVATAAIREAPNRDELAAAVEARAAFPVRILSGSDEARLSFLGATKTLAAPVDGAVAVVDVGGGSTEIALGTVPGGVSWSETFRVGSGSLTDSYMRSDPPAARELHAIREHVTGVFEGLEPPGATALEHGLAVGGSAASLRRVIGAELSHETLDRAIQILCREPAAEVAQRFELEPQRVRLLPAGMLVLEAVSDCLALPLTVANGGLREGVILEMVGETALQTL